MSDQNEFSVPGDVTSNPAVVAQQNTSQANSKKPFLLIGIILLFVTLIIGYFFNKQKGSKISSTSNVSVPTSAPQPTVKADMTANWKIYKSTRSDYQIKYPNAYQTAADPKSKNQDLFIHAPSATNKGDSMVIVITAERQIKYTDASVWAIKEKEEPELLKDFILDGVKAAYYEKEAGGSENPFPFAKNVYLVKNGYGYEILAQAETKSELQFFDQILSTFKFTDQTNRAAQTYLVIPEWRIRLPLSPDLLDLKTTISGGTAYSQTDQDVRILAPELDTGWQCVADENENKATVGSIVRTSNDVRSGPYTSLVTKKLGSYNYSYEASATSNCTTDPKYQELIKEIGSTFNQLEDY